MNIFRMENFCTNWPMIQMGVDKTQEPTTAVTMAKPEASERGR